MKFVIAVAAFVCLASYCQSFEFGEKRRRTTPEQELVAYLLRGYEKVGRPIYHPEKTLRVGYTNFLNQILDQHDDSLRISSNPVWRWKDEALKWNPKAFHGITQIALSPRDIWTPDFVIYNDVYDNWADINRAIEAVQLWVLYDGTVVMSPSYEYQVLCDATKKHDYKIKNCTFTIGSWVYTADELEPYFINNEAEFNLTYYTETEGIEIKSQSAEKVLVYYDVPVENTAYWVFNYNLVVKISPEYYRNEKNYERHYQKKPTRMVNKGRMLEKNDRSY